MLYKRAVPELKETVQRWIETLIKQAVKESSSGYVNESPELPEKFSRTLRRMLRESYAQGWWLNHLYVRELEGIYTGRKYRGKVTLADTATDNELRDMLEDFMSMEETGGWEEVIPQAAIDWLRDYVPVLAGSLRESVLEGVRDVISSSLQSGATLSERMKALRESSGELAAMSARRIEAIARTEITRADTLGRLSSMRGNSDVLGVEFSAIMDDRTTEICSSRHGLVMRLDDPRLPENTPPCHVNCRSLLIPCTVYDYPDGLLTSHEYEEVPAGTQRPEDIQEVQKLFESVVEENSSSTDAPSDRRTWAEGIIKQDEEYTRQYEDLQVQIDAAVSRRDIAEYNRLSALQNDVLTQMNALGTQLREAKIEMAEQGVIYASGITKTLASDDVREIISTIEGAPAPIRRVWNLFEDRMKIADTASRESYYQPSEGAVYVDVSTDRYGSGGRLRYGVLFHELGHLIDDKSASAGLYFSSTAELQNSLTAEVNSYVSSTLERLRVEAVLAGQSPKGVKKSDAYAAVEKELNGQLPKGAKMAVSDVFSGVTKNKVHDGWFHSTSYWKQDEEKICLEFFAQTFADSINNPEAIETTKKYFPESYKIFERMLHDIGGKKS